MWWLWEYERESVRTSVFLEHHHLELTASPVELYQAQIALNRAHILDILHRLGELFAYLHWDAADHHEVMRNHMFGSVNHDAHCFVESYMCKTSLHLGDIPLIQRQKHSAPYQCLSSTRSRTCHETAVASDIAMLPDPSA